VTRADAAEIGASSGVATAEAWSRDFAPGHSPDRDGREVPAATGHRKVANATDAGEQMATLSTTSRPADVIKVERNLRRRSMR